MRLDALEDVVKALCFSPGGATLEGVEQRRLDVYRDAVRRTLGTNIVQCLPVATSIVGEAAMRALALRFLDEVAPQTRIFWRIPLEFAAFINTIAAQSPQDLPHPAFAELVHYEAAGRDVLLAPDREQYSDIIATPHADLGAVLDPSCRLLVYAHNVHVLKKGQSWPAARRTPVCLVVYRQHERFFWLDVHPHLAQTLAVLDAGHALGDAYSALDEQLGAPTNRRFINSQLAGLVRRGALLGFAPPKPPEP